MIALEAGRLSGKAEENAQSSSSAAGAALAGVAGLPKSNRDEGGCDC